MRWGILLCFVSLVLFGCQTKDESYYLANAGEAEKEMQKCQQRLEAAMMTGNTAEYQKTLEDEHCKLLNKVVVDLNRAKLAAKREAEEAEGRREAEARKAEITRLKPLGEATLRQKAEQASSSGDSNSASIISEALSELNNDIRQKFDKNPEAALAFEAQCKQDAAGKSYEEKSAILGSMECLAARDAAYRVHKSEEAAQENKAAGEFEARVGAYLAMPLAEFEEQLAATRAKADSTTGSMPRDIWEAAKRRIEVVTLELTADKPRARQTFNDCSQKIAKYWKSSRYKEKNATQFSVTCEAALKASRQVLGYKGMGWTGAQIP